MLSVLFAIEACYTIKENINKEKPFCRRKLPFLLAKIVKSLFCVGIFLPRQENMNCKG